MKFKNGNRTFISDFRVKDERGYIKVEDKQMKSKFYLPEKVLNQIGSTFSWDTYREDLNEVETKKQKVKELLENELIKLENINPKTETTIIAISHFKDMLSNFN